MSDEFASMFDIGGNDGSANHLQSITPNIDFQLLNQTSLPQQCLTVDSKSIRLSEINLFATTLYLDNLKKLILSRFDIPLLIYGQPGTGKLTSLLTMIKYLPEYMQDYNIDNIDNIDTKLNCIDRFTIYNNEWYRLMYLDNVYYLNLNLFLNDTDKLEYLKYIYKISKAQSFDKKKKIFTIFLLI